MWEMTHQSILGFVPLSFASLSVAHGYKWFPNGNLAINTNLAKLKTYNLCSGCHAEGFGSLGVIKAVFSQCSFWHLLSHISRNVCLLHVSFYNYAVTWAVNDLYTVISTQTQRRINWFLRFQCYF